MIQLAFISYYFPPLQHSGTLRAAAFCANLPNEGVSPVIFCSSDFEVKKQNIVGHTVEEIHADAPVWGDVYRFDWGLNHFSPNRLLPLWNRFPIANHLVRRRRLRQLSSGLVADVVKKMRARNCSAILSTYGPAINIEVGVAAARETGLPLILDMRDPWCHMPTPPHRHYVDFLLAKQVEKNALSLANAILVTTDAHKTLLTTSMSLPDAKIHVVRNGFDDQQTSQNANPYDDEFFNVVHTGTIGLDTTPDSVTSHIKRMLLLDYDPLRTDYSTRSVQPFITLAQQLQRTSPEKLKKTLFTFVGVSDVEKAQLCVPIHLKRHFRFVARVSQDQADNFAQHADLLVLNQVTQVVAGTPTHVCVPAKLYTYMRTGNPILALLYESEIDAILKEYAAFHICEPHHLDDAVRFVERVFLSWEEGRPMRGEVRVARQFHRKNQAQQLATLVRTLVNDVKRGVSQATYNVGAV